MASSPVRVKEEPATPSTSSRALRSRRGLQLETPDSTKPATRPIEEEQSPKLLKSFTTPPATPSPSRKRPATDDGLRAKKIRQYTQHARGSPFPDFSHPTPAECKLAHRILASLHGARKRPAELKASTTRAGCGDSPSVLDALVRTILSQNTSNTNSARAKRSMDRAYGRSDNWDAIVAGGRDRLEEAIKCGGLSKVKSKVIIDVLEQVHERHGDYSLEHLHSASTDRVMEELLTFRGVGPKTASCVVLFCLGRDSFAVDTHVWRITGLLGWRPAKASRDETHLHLDARIPDEDKYGLHVLLVSHGRSCEECRAGGRSVGRCELRKAFRRGKLEGEAGEDLAQEEAESTV
ncbi:DNA glycosylase [Thozetella sp. PMI_491]|nr:DNA glycosylase [Thozetella sp. PMI_491]